MNNDCEPSDAILAAFLFSEAHSFWQSFFLFLRDPERCEAPLMFFFLLLSNNRSVFLSVKGRVVFLCGNLHTLPLDRTNPFPAIGCAEGNREIPFPDSFDLSILGQGTAPLKTTLHSRWADLWKQFDLPGVLTVRTGITPSFLD